MDRSLKAAKFANKNAALWQTGFEIKLPPPFCPSNSSSITSKSVDDRTLGGFATHEDFDTGKEYNSVKF